MGSNPTSTAIRLSSSSRSAPNFDAAIGAPPSSWSRCVTNRQWLAIQFAAGPEYGVQDPPLMQPSYNMVRPPGSILRNQAIDFNMPVPSRHVDGTSARGPTRRAAGQLSGLYVSSCRARAFAFDRGRVGPCAVSNRSSILDGNGRVARSLITFLLVHAGELQRPLLYPDDLALYCPGRPLTTGYHPA